MNQNLARDQRRDSLQAAEARRRRRIRPTLLALEERTLMSTFTVNNPTDTPVIGETDLRQAIDQANAASGASTIDFDSTVFGTPQTITLAGSQLELSNTSEAEAITGPVAGVTVSGGGLSRVFQVDSGVSASISGMTITSGNTTYSGGGLYNDGGALALSDCTVNSNSASVGGGIFVSNGGSTALTNCTVSGNSASFGGGLYSQFASYSLEMLTNCTVSGNYGYNGGGLYNGYDCSAALINTIVTGNSYPYGGTASDIGGSATVSGNNNLIGTGGSGGLVNGVDGNFVGLGNLALGALGNYGGPTETMPLLPGSPAIDGGTSGPGVPTTDQRGLGWAGAVDIGAFESQGFSLTLVAGSTPQTAAIGTAFANSLAVIVTANNPVEPVDGGVVTFTAMPHNGTTAILSASSGVIANGQATTNAAPNNAVGSYTVVASAGSSLTGSFALTNTGTPFSALVVNTWTSDSLFPGAGLLSLRAAVAFANFDSQGISSISFDPTVFATSRTITLTGSQLELSNTGEMETITGPAAGVTISGAGLTRVLEIDGSVTASITGLTITGGSAGSGGGLYNDGGTAALTDVSISSNSAVNKGGGLYDAGGTTTLNDCIISGNSASSHAFGAGGGLANSGGTTTLTNCSVSGNSAGDSGGGLYNHGGTTTLTNGTIVSGNYARYDGAGLCNYGGTTALTNCTVSANSVGSLGGGLANLSGSTALTNCTVSGNSAVAGGGVENEGLLALTNCTLSGNTGGGVDTYEGTATLTNCTISGNFSHPNQNGAGVGNIFGKITLTDCSITNNLSAANGAGLFDAGGTTVLTNCTVSGNTAGLSGGGLFAVTAPFHSIGTTTLTNCTISGNSADKNGGGVDNNAGGTITLTNCTVSGNSAANGKGGGVYNTYGSKFFPGATTLTDSTVSGNSASSGGGLDNVKGTVTVGNTIVAENTASTNGPDALGTVTSHGNNLVGESDGSSGWVGSDLTGTIVQPLNALLAPLGNYGGPTETMALLPGSPAIDAGNNALIPTGVTADQRGLPRVVNNIVDIGAFESSGFTIAVTSGSGQTTGVLTAFLSPLVVTVRANNSIEPVAGGLVTFTAPSNGATAALSGSPATISPTGAASVAAAANGIAGSYDVTATASGITNPASFSLTNDPLIIALDPATAGAISLSGSASINTPGIVYVDSSSSVALTASGNAQVTAGAIDVHGGFVRSGHASLSPTPVTGAAGLAVVSVPSPSTTGMINDGSFSLGGNSSATIEPGIYSKISISGNAKLTMASGIYIIEGGGFHMSGSATVTGSGVMIVNAGSNYPASGGTYGSITISGNATINLSPATSGAYAGIVIFQPSDNTKTLTITGNAAGITGTVYAPAAAVTESGSAALTASLIVDRLTISGNGVADALSMAGPAVAGGWATLFDVIDGGNVDTGNADNTVRVFDRNNPLMIKVTDASGKNVRLSSLPVVSISVAGPRGNPVPQTAAVADSSASSPFESRSTTGTDPFMRTTTVGS